MPHDETEANIPEKHPSAARRSDSDLIQRLAYSGMRWTRLLVLALLAAVAFELILPLAWHRAKSKQLRCATVNAAERTSCTKCNLVGPELKTEVQKIVDPASAAQFDDDDDD